jgi:hypothetical protein
VDMELDQDPYDRFDEDLSEEVLNPFHPLRLKQWCIRPAPWSWSGRLR